MQDSSNESIARREFLKTSMLAGSGIFIGSRLLTDGGHEVQAQSAATDTVAIRLRVNGTSITCR